MYQRLMSLQNNNLIIIAMKTFPLIITFLLMTHLVLLAQMSKMDNGTASVKTGAAKMDVGSEAFVNVTGTLTIDPGGKLTIHSDGALTVTNTLTNNSPVTGLVIENGGSLITQGSISGTATIKHEIAGNMGWHFLSSPVSYQEICNGTLAPLPANFSTTSSTSYDFYKFNSLCGSLWWLNLRNNDLSVNTTDFGTPPRFEVKSGYLVAYGPDFPTTKVFTGIPNTGDQTFSLSPSSSACSWNLIGNPYPSAVDWDLVTGKSNLVNGYYYVYNENKAGGPGYESYLDASHKTPGVNGKIHSMQGFFVHASGTSIEIPNTSRTHETDTWLKESPNTNKLTLTLSDGTYYDNAYILFEENGKNGSDWYDATKMLTMDKQVPQIYTMISGDQKTLINSMPVISSPITIPVGIVASSDGNYNINVSGIENFSSLTGLVLEDLKTNCKQNLLQNPVYNFSASGNEDDGRFLLHFNGDLNNPNDENPVKIYSSEKTIYIFCATGLQNGHIILSNMLGQQILSQNLIDQPLNQIMVNTVKGYYIVKVQCDYTVKTSRVYVN
jgi:hypothetical protein